MPYTSILFTPSSSPGSIGTCTQAQEPGIRIIACLSVCVSLCADAAEILTPPNTCCVLAHTTFWQAAWIGQSIMQIPQPPNWYNRGWDRSAAMTSNSKQGCLLNLLECVCAFSCEQQPCVSMCALKDTCWGRTYWLNKIISDKHIACQS